jgi:hypothetical protein
MSVFLPESRSALQMFQVTMYPASDHQAFSSIDDEESVVPSERSKEASPRSMESDKSIQGVEPEEPKCKRHREGHRGLEPMNSEVCTSVVNSAIHD